MSVELEQVDAILSEYTERRGLLVPILQDIQARYNYLPREALERVAEQRHIPLSQVYTVANFYAAFSLAPRGKHIVSVCMGTACHVRGAVKVLEKIEHELGIKTGQSTPDLKFTLETVNCVGACALGPMVIIGEDYHGEMSPDTVGSVLENYT